MEKSRFFKEIERLGKPYGFYVSGITDNGLLELSSGQHYLCRVDEKGAVYYPSQNEAELETFLPKIDAARKYIAAMEQAPPLHADGLGEGYVKLAEFEGTVLAGKDMRQHGYQFITWDWTYDHKGLNHGHYYKDYAAAKEDFAFRASLVPEYHRFSPEQAKALHNAIDIALDNDLAQNTQEAEYLEQCREKLQAAYPDLEEQSITPDQRPEHEPTITM